MGTRFITRSMFAALVGSAALLNVSIAATPSPMEAQQFSQAKPLCFTENKGQWDERVLFKAEGAGGLTWFIERDGFTLLFSVTDTTAKPLGRTGIPACPSGNDDWTDKNVCPTGVDRTRPIYPSSAHALKFRFQQALPHTAGEWLPQQTTPAEAASVEPSERLSWNNNYFLGNDPSKWAPDCGNFQRVVLKDVWEGVDVVWRGSGDSQQIKRIEQMREDPESASSAQSAVNMIEFDFLIHPGADPSQIRLECLGLTGDLEATADGGELLLPTSLGVLRQALPEAFQIEPEGSLAPVRAEFRVEGGNSFGVALPEGHNPNQPLIVDPLVYSTYLGGDSDDIATTLIPDGAGGIIVAGYTLSQNFPTTEGAYQRNHGGRYDAFVAGVIADGSALIYCTYLGGNDLESAHDLIPDGVGGLVVAGYTHSQNFPTTEGAYQRNPGGGWDAFITRLNAEGNALTYSTFLGGDTTDVVYGLAPDGVGGGIAAGYTYSANFPTTEGAYQRNPGGDWDAIITRLNAEGSTLIYSTYLGGNQQDGARALAPDGAGGVIVTGWTYGDNFPTTQGANQRNFGGGEWDAFIARLNDQGSVLIYSTYLGGNNNDYANALIPDGARGVVVVGETNSDNFPTTEGAYQMNYGGGDWDAFITSLNAEGSALIYSTYLGGNNPDQASDIVPDGAGGVVVAGLTGSGNFPTTEGAYQRNHGGGWDAFITRLNAEGNALTYSTFLGGDTTDVAYALAPDGAGGVIAAGFTNGDFPTTEGAYQRSNGGEYDAFITRIEIGLAGRSLQWVRVSGAFATTERNIAGFDIAGEGGVENAELTLTFHRNNIPEAATFEDHGDGSGTFNWQTTYGDAGNYTAGFTLSDGEQEISAEVNFEVRELFHIPLSNRWNLVSSVVPPANGDMRVVWADPVGRGNVLLVKDQSGLFYLPAQDFNQMRDWNIGQGYYARITAADTLVIAGDPVAVETPIPLTRVWSIVAYYPREELSPRVAFANIADDLELAKDEQGRFYWPSGNFSNMGNLRRGKGYQLRIARATELVWNVGGGRMQNAECRMKNENANANADADVHSVHPVHFVHPEPTGRNMSVLIANCKLQIANCGEIGVFTKDGLCVGAAAVGQAFLPVTSERQTGMSVLLGMAIWGDDPTTEEIDGAREGEAIYFRLWDGQAETPILLVWEEGKGIYVTDGFAMGEVKLGQTGMSVLPADYSLSAAYPNPFNSTSLIRYDLPEAARVRLCAYDLAGRLTATLVNGGREAGWHEALFDASALPAGLYVLRLETSTGFSAVGKAMVVK